MKFNFRKTALMLGVLMMCLTPILALTETPCVACNLSGEIVVTLENLNGLSIYEPLGTLANRTYFAVSVTNYHKGILSYSADDGLITFSIDGKVIEHFAPELKSFQTITIHGNSLEFGLTDIKSIILNGNAISSEIHTANLNQGGIIISNIPVMLKSEDMILTFDVKLPWSFVGEFPKLTISLSNSTTALNLPDKSISAGNIESMEFEVLDEAITNELGGLTSKILQTTKRNLKMSGVVIWEKVNITYVNDFEILSFLSNGQRNLEALVYNGIFQTSEVFDLNGVVSSWVTLNVNDGVGDGFSTQSVNSECFSILPQGEYDIYYILN